MTEPRDDSWTPTVCYMCYSCCGLKVQRINGTVVDIRGDPDNPHSQGKICAKGTAGIMGLYDPYRVKTPLRRTNPKKGIGVDPQWEEISWDEALDIVSQRLKKIRQDDPRKLLQVGLDFYFNVFYGIFCSAFGTPNRIPGPAGYFCGPVLHMAHYLTEGSFFAEVDFHNCNYCLLVGNQEGFMVNLNSNTLSQRMAEARERGMRVVVIDPVCTNAGSKANEWVPIRPGTDGALALAMLNLLLNEYEIYDVDFIRRYTNGPYLVGSDGYYVRDQPSGKPFVWDSGEGRAKVYDDPEIKEYALDGTFDVNGLKAIPAFTLLKEHVQKYDPEEVSRITSVPAKTIRRLAKELGEAARIGSKVVIDGVELPCRPAAVIWTRGAGAHKHGTMTGLALHLLNITLGNIDVPGGILGNRTLTPAGGPKEGPDGLLVPADFELMLLGPYPARKAQAPTSLNLIDLFPISSSAANPAFEEGVLEPEKYGLPYKPEALLHINSNFMMTASCPDRMAEVLKKIPFMVSFAIYLDETVQFADIVLPDTHNLERLIPFPNHRTLGMAVGPGPWYWPIAQPVSKPDPGVKSWMEVILELADRVGITRDFNTIMNVAFRFKEPHRLDPDNKYTWEEIADTWAKSWFGKDKDLTWFKQHGLLVTEDKPVEQAYPRPFLKPRIPIYFEHFIGAGEDLEKVTKKMGTTWDISDYQPLPDWKPCPAYQDNAQGYDLYAINYKIPFHTSSFTAQNPWLDELGCYHPSAYKILINSQVAAKKNIKDGNLICIESREGRVKGEAKIVEGIHPEVVGVAGAFGHWTEDMPVAKGKGVHFNRLISSGLDRMDMISTVLDACVKVKAYRVEE